MARVAQAGWLLLALLLAPAQAAQAAISVRDGADQWLTLPASARRIVSLSPHATEMLYAIGAGSRLVATVDYSNYPPAARQLPRVGGYSGVSLEAVMRQQPDLVVAWQDGGNPRELQRLRQLGVPVFISHPLQLEDVAREMRSLGQLTATQAPADAAASHYRQRLQQLRQRYARRPPLTVFYQISSAPIFTVSQRSFMGSVMQLCGGRNVFGGLAQAAPQVSMEAVVAAQPQVMLAGRADILRMWDRWPALPAVAKATRYVVDEDLLTIPGPRLLDGAVAMCATLDTARRSLGLTLD